MEGPKNNHYQEQKLNERVYKREKNLKNAYLNSVLQNLTENSQVLLIGKKKSIDFIRRKKQLEDKKKFYKDIEHDVLKPVQPFLRIFSQSKPLNIGDTFLNEKQKMKLLLSERAYSKKPNIVSGSYRKRIVTQTQQQKGDWISRKYSEFDDIVTEQSGALRMIMKKKQNEQCPYINKNPIYMGKGQRNQKELFSVFQPCSSDFYQDKKLKETLSTNIFISTKTKTDNLLQSSVSNMQFPSIKLKISNKFNISSQMHSTKRRVSTNFA